MPVSTSSATEKTQLTSDQAQANLGAGTIINPFGKGAGKSGKYIESGGVDLGKSKVKGNLSLVINQLLGGGASSPAPAPSAPGPTPPPPGASQQPAPTPDSTPTAETSLLDKGKAGFDKIVGWFKKPDGTWNKPALFFLALIVALVLYRKFKR